MILSPMQIEGMDEDNARVVIKLAISNQSVTISQYAVELVDKDEYKKYAKDLGEITSSIILPLASSLFCCCLCGDHRY